MSEAGGQLRYECVRECDRAFLKAVVGEVLQRYDNTGRNWRFPATSTAWLLSPGGSAAVLGVCIQGRPCCVKLFYNRSLKNRWRARLGCSKPRRAYRHALGLQRAGVSCPAPIGYAEVRPWGPGLLVTDLIEDGQRLDHWIEREGVSQEGLAGLARFLRAMHDRGITHRDLSPRNMLVRPDGSTLLLLDYEDTRFAARVSERARLDDLHHLNERCLMSVSLKNRLRCLRGYAGFEYRRYRDKLNRRVLRSRSKYVEAYRRAFGPEDRRTGR